MKTRILLLLAIIFSSAYAFAQDDQGKGDMEGILTDDRDGQQYQWVRIGDQIWMARNLNIGNLIVVRNNVMSSEVIIEKFCYEDNPAYCRKFGGLYTDQIIRQYYDGEGSQSICPAGWHLPSEGEWMKLLNYLGGPDAAGGALKDTAAIWQGKIDRTATNSSGFTALPGGGAIHDEDAFFYGGVGKFCYFWTSTEDISLIYLKKGIRYVYLVKNKDIVRFATSGVGAAHSVRCVKD